jgi:hypothetical protein
MKVYAVTYRPRGCPAYDVRIEGLFSTLKAAKVQWRKLTEDEEWPELSDFFIETYKMEAE